MFIDLHVKYVIVFTLRKLGYSRQISEKYSNIKFNENPSIGSRVVDCGLKGGQTDMALIVAFRNFANMFKNELVYVRVCSFVAVSSTSACTSRGTQSLF